MSKHLNDKQIEKPVLYYGCTLNTASLCKI